MDPRSVHGPLWIAVVAGICFMLAGTSVAVGAIHGVSETGEPPQDSGWWMRLFYYVLGLVIAGSLASIGSWVAFGPGPRAFSGTGLFLLSPEAGAMVGRAVFGFGAVLTWLCTIALAVSGARKLWSSKST
jgi:hypothetical protein